MNGEPLRTKVVITNPQGFHMRPQKAFAETAQRFQSSVTVLKDDRSLNGKSLWELMLLGAEQGTELTIEVRGSDAEQALPVLARVLAAPSVDEIAGASTSPAG